MSAFTKKAIRETFLTLLRKKPVSRITIREIVEECGINRNTFYYHYQDLPQLIEEIITDETERVINQCNNISSIEECVEVVVNELMRNKIPILHLHQSSVSSRIFYEQYLRKVCVHFTESFLKITLSETEISEADRNTLTHFYQCTCFGYLIEWLDGGMKTDVLADFHRLCELKQNISLEDLHKTYGKKSDT
ncbi:MAG: TetR/AcrR family transcriptional regulator [Oscillospiraceae bacterium]